jgi:hypothetical protein
MAIKLECRPVAGVLETTRPLLARENAMRLSRIRRTTALAAAVSVTGLAAVGARPPRNRPVDDPSQYGESITDVGPPRRSNTAAATRSSSAKPGPARRGAGGLASTPRSPGARAD